ncbi:MAG: hypothetical protein BGO10_10160 [Chlamydia sp. 32-24]|nr:MAG: hypothetical protein BGO10_10160 [Chlamydia sp. 32-24]
MACETNFANISFVWKGNDYWKCQDQSGNITDGCVVLFPKSEGDPLYGRVKNDFWRSNDSAFKKMLIEQGKNVCDQVKIKNEDLTDLLIRIQTFHLSFQQKNYLETKWEQAICKSVSNIESSYGIKYKVEDSPEAGKNYCLVFESDLNEDVKATLIDEEKIFPTITQEKVNQWKINYSNLCQELFQQTTPFEVMTKGGSKDEQDLALLLRQNIVKKMNEVKTQLYMIKIFATDEGDGTASFKNYSSFQ